MQTAAFFEHVTGSISYVVHDEKTGDAIIIDPMFDWKHDVASLVNDSLRRIVRHVNNNKLVVRWVLDTHVPADHVSAAQVLGDALKSPTATGAGFPVVRALLLELFGWPELTACGPRWNRLLRDDELLRAGSLEARAVHTPGHTLACVSFLIGDAVFTGASLLLPDVGTGRCDLLAGDAGLLYDSIAERLYTLPKETRVFVGWDPIPAPRKRETCYMTTIGDSRTSNLILRDGVSRDEFIHLRRDCDGSTPPPESLHRSLRINLAPSHAQMTG
jgi:glyoxylase-like metal-dependent hydrolase (beta-lactamase superfamily II)